MKRQATWLVPLALLASSPAAGGSLAASPLGTGATSASFIAPEIARPLALPQTPVAAPLPHPRVLPLQGGRNFRDLGGYRTADGHHVKWGLLFRSGAMNGLTAADYAYLQSLGIKVVCDFRSTSERKAEPSNWPPGTAPAILADDYLIAQSGAIPKGDMRGWNPEQARAAMAATYPAMLVSFAGQYRRMFGELLAGHAPLAFHCTVGKDRSGVAAALILIALGVPRHTVIADYLLTNRVLDKERLLKGQAAGLLNGLPAPARNALLTADRSYIEAALQALDQHKDGAAGYLRDEMGLSAADIARLRQLYLA